MVEEEAAATKVQAGFRGHQDRKRVAACEAVRVARVERAARAARAASRRERQRVQPVKTNTRSESHRTEPRDRRLSNPTQDFIRSLLGPDSRQTRCSWLNSRGPLPRRVLSVHLPSCPSPRSPCSGTNIVRKNSSSCCPSVAPPRPVLLSSAAASRASASMASMILSVALLRGRPPTSPARSSDPQPAKLRSDVLEHLHQFLRRARGAWDGFRTLQERILVPLRHLSLHIVLKSATERCAYGFRSSPSETSARIANPPRQTVQRGGRALVRRRRARRPVSQPRKRIPAFHKR